MSHAVKLYERVREERIRLETSVNEEQFFFLSELHLIFMNLEKVYDCTKKGSVALYERQRVLCESSTRHVSRGNHGSAMRYGSDRDVQSKGWCQPSASTVCLI